VNATQGLEVAHLPVGKRYARPIICEQMWPDSVAKREIRRIGGWVNKCVLNV